MGDEDGDLLRLMESSQERKRRYFSVGVMSFTAFTFNLAFSIVLTSAYPYLIQASLIFSIFHRIINLTVT